MIQALCDGVGQGPCVGLRLSLVRMDVMLLLVSSCDVGYVQGTVGYLVASDVSNAVETIHRLRRRLAQTDYDASAPATGDVDVVDMLSSGCDRECSSRPKNNGTSEMEVGVDSDVSGPLCAVIKRDRLSVSIGMSDGSVEPHALCLSDVVLMRKPAKVASRNWPPLGGESQSSLGTTCGKKKVEPDGTLLDVWSAFASPLRMHVHVDDTPLFDGRGLTGDGIIVATPSGSAAYNMSVGGPVCSAHVRGIAMITPIAPYRGRRQLIPRPQDRAWVDEVVPLQTPFIVDTKSSVRLALAEGSRVGADVACDGWNAVHLQHKGGVSADTACGRSSSPFPVDVRICAAKHPLVCLGPNGVA